MELGSFGVLEMSKKAGVFWTHSDKNSMLVRNKQRENLEVNKGTAAGMADTKLTLTLREAL